MNKKRLHRMLDEYCDSDALPMHMPGGKRRVGRYSSRDITEIMGFDDLHSPHGAIKDLESEIASLWHAQRAYISVNGATAMIEAAVCAAMRYHPEGKVLAASNCHLSVWHAIEMTGCMHRIVNPVFGNAPFALEVRAEDIDRALTEDPSIRCVVITSPTYEGIISDTKAVMDVTIRHGCLLIVDCAHGAHLGLDGYGCEDTCGDIVIKSTHKTLSSPTQTAVMLDHTGKISEEDIRHYIDIYESSSPSYLLMSGISEMVELLGREDAFTGWKSGIELVLSRLASLKNIRLYDADNKDRSRFVLLCRGKEMARILRDEYRIEVEAAYDTHLIAMSGIGDNSDTLGRFAEAVTAIDKMHPELGTSVSPFELNDLHDARMSLAEAARTPCSATPVNDAEGLICAGSVYDYPPGIPVLLPGDLISAEAVRYLAKTGRKTILTITK